MNTNAKKCIERLNELTGLGLALDANEAAVFSYQGQQVLLRFLSEEHVCLVHVQLAVLEEAALPDALYDLLEANFLLSDTKGGALSFSRETHMAALNFLLPLNDTNAEDFIHRLNRVLACAEEWREKIVEKNSQAIEDASKHFAALRAGTASTVDDHKIAHAMRSHMMSI